MDVKDKINVYINQNEKVDIDSMEKIEEANAKLELMIKAIADHVSTNIKKVGVWFKKYGITFNDAVNLVKNVEKKRDWMGLSKAIAMGKEY